MITVSNGDVVVDIPPAFAFPHSDEDEEDEEDETQNSNVKRRGRRKRTTWRPSNALNEDRYDFCLVVDTTDNDDEEGDGDGKKANNQQTKKCCLCPTANKTYKKSGEEQDDDNDDDNSTSAVVVNVSPSKKNTQSRRSSFREDDHHHHHYHHNHNSPPTDLQDPATQYDNGPMQRLQLQRRRARRSGALRGEDDDCDSDSGHPDCKEEGTVSSFNHTLFTTTDGDETLSVEHTGVGLSGMRMVSLIRLKLRKAGLRVKRVQNLKGTRTLLKVRAEQSRLEDEAERMRLVMRTRDGGYARFKKCDRHVFCGAGYGSESDGHVLFRSSDRQSILLHIIKSPRDVGGAQLPLNQGEPCGDAIKMMFPVHMILRLHQLRRTWSTACFCCRTPPTSRYGNRRRGRVFQQSDAGEMLTSTPFAFNAAGDATKHDSEDECHDDDDNNNDDDDDSNSDNQNNVGECRCRCYQKCCSWETMVDVLTFGWLVRQPLDAISEYFGETVGFYFAFLEFYTTWLVFPTIAGIILFCFQVYEKRVDHWLLPFYSLFLGLWSMLFLVRWRRRRVELAYRWGVMDHEEEEIERVEFKGTTRISQVTGANEKYYNPTIRNMKQICCTIPMTMGWLVGVVMLMLWLFNLRDSIMDKFQGQQQQQQRNMTNTTTLTNMTTRRHLPSTFLNFETASTPGTSMSLSLSDRYEYGNDMEFWLYLLIPPMMAGMMIPILDKLYLKLATLLNKWENHKTESSHQYHLIAKVLSFRMVNCFCSLYYYAFSGRHPILRLTVQLASFMVVGQLQKHAKEVLWPCIKQHVRGRCAKRALRAESRKREKWELENINNNANDGKYHGRGENNKENKMKKKMMKKTPLSERRLKQAEEEAWTEASMPNYDTFNDYAEMMVQYGYVTFFSMAFPLAPGLALLNNVVEIRSDAFKLCNNTRRPVARKAAGIGVWFRTLQLMSVVAVLTNLAHIGFTSDQFQLYFPDVTHAEKVVIIFGFEHVVLCLQWVLTALVPDAPFWVRRSIRREKHLSKERLQEQFAEELRNKK